MCIQEQKKQVKEERGKERVLGEQKTKIGNERFATE